MIEDLPNDPSVNETVKRLIINWPNLYPVRIEALAHIFTAKTVSWCDGCEGHYPYPNALDEADGKAWTTEEADQEVMEHVCLSGMSFATLAAHRIVGRRQAAKARFARENAELLAIATLSGIDHEETCPPFEIEALNRIPTATLTPAWRMALVEFCHGLLAYPESRVDKAMLGRQSEDLAKAMQVLSATKAVAAEALRRCGKGSAFETRLRQRRLDALRKEAAIFGYDLAPIDAAQPATGLSGRTPAGRPGSP